MTDRRTSIADALPAVPTVLCAIIADYADRQPHEFIGVGSASIGGRSVKTPTLAVTNCKLTHYDKRSYGAISWYRFVLNADLRNGLLNWTIGWKDKGYGSFGCGIMTDAEHLSSDDRSGYGNIGQNSFICPSSSSSSSSSNFQKVYHNGDWLERNIHRPPSESKQMLADAQFDADGYIDFTADPTTRQIIARYSDGAPGFVVVTAATDDEFWSFRPCVAVAGKIDVCMLSDPKK